MSTAASLSTYRSLAVSQGVVRPFDILLRMGDANRRLVAGLLGCNLDTSIDPQAQAWRIINQNLRGLQARTHTLPEQITPFSRNNNWWEIVTRTAQRNGISFYPGVEEAEVERLVFERFARDFVQADVMREADAVDSLADAHPVLRQVMASLELSRDATLSVLSGIAFATARADDSLRDGCYRAADWFRGHLRWPWAVSISSGLGLLQEKLTDIYGSWAKRCRNSGTAAKVATAVAMIYFQDLIDRSMDEFDRC